jgi:hypothetical protein
MITGAQFVIDFPEFDTSNQTDPTAPVFTSAITFWLVVAYKMLNADRWGDMLDLGAELFTAHNVVLEALAKRNMDTGNIPGVATGAIAGMGAGDVTISYNTAAVLELGAGHWNYTVFGQRFIHMANLMGSGPLQIGPGWGCGSGYLNGPGWPGPGGGSTGW